MNSLPRHQPYDWFRFPQLPPRLSRLVGPIAEGLSNAEISARLGLAQHTVENYVSELMAELGVETRPRLVVVCQGSASES
jgi:DNA-binding NarL/FixJ family response regulator